MCQFGVSLVLLSSCSQHCTRGRQMLSRQMIKHAWSTLSRQTIKDDHVEQIQMAQLVKEKVFHVLSLMSTPTITATY
jgi:hypothetical protein